MPAPKPCPGLWTKLGRGLRPWEGKGIHNSLGNTYLSTYQPGQQVYFWEADLRPRHTLRYWKGPTEGGREVRAAVAQGEVLAATKSIHHFCASTGTTMDVHAAYLKSKGEGQVSGRPSYPFSVLLPCLFWVQVCFRLKATTVWSNFTEPLKQADCWGRTVL